MQPVLEGCSQHLSELRLDCGVYVCKLPAAFHQQLSKLHTVRIRLPVKGYDREPCMEGLVPGCGQLAQLPSLQSLVVYWEPSLSYSPLPAPALTAFGSCTQLTRLSLTHGLTRWLNMLGDGSAVLELAPRLARMHTLQQLHLGGLGGADHFNVRAAWRQLCAAVPSCVFCGKWSLRTAVCPEQRASWLLQHS